MKRLFIAVPVQPSPTLISLSGELKKALKNEKINWVDLQNLHFTLQFLGDTPESLIPAIINETGQAAETLQKAAGLLKGLGYFSSNRMPNVLYTHLENMPEMNLMAAGIRQALARAGITAGNREFKAHLTLGRIRFLNDKRHFIQLVESMKDIDIQKITASEIILYESLLRPSGPVYHKLAIFTLKS